jgi:hypothetical protein
MKITGSPIGGPGRVNGAAGGAVRKPGGFAVAGGGAAQGAAATARAGGPGGVGSLDALLALQALDGPLERRRRSVKRAGRILDELDGIKVALLDGEGVAGALSKLSDAVRQERSATEDAKLESVLDEIEVRAAVEMAKREARSDVTTAR